MWFRVRVVGGESVENGGGTEIDAFTIQRAGQETPVVNLVECGHPEIVFRVCVGAKPLVFTPQHALHRNRIVTRGGNPPRNDSRPQPSAR